MSARLSCHSLSACPLLVINHSEFEICERKPKCKVKAQTFADVFEQRNNGLLQPLLVRHLDFLHILVFVCRETSNTASRSSVQRKSGRGRLRNESEYSPMKSCSWRSRSYSASYFLAFCACFYTESSETQTKVGGGGDCRSSHASTPAPLLR